MGIGGLLPLGSAGFFFCGVSIWGVGVSCKIGPQHKDW